MDSGFGSVSQFHSVFRQMCGFTPRRYRMSVRSLRGGLTPRSAPRGCAPVTATPWRGDGYDVDQLLGPPLVRMGIAEGLAKGFLSDVDYRLLADNINWQMVQEASSHRYSLTHLNRQLILPTRDEEAASSSVR